MSRLKQMGPIHFPSGLGLLPTLHRPDEILSTWLSSDENFCEKVDILQALHRLKLSFTYEL